jgi:hypothetical protein
VIAPGKSADRTDVGWIISAKIRAEVDTIFGFEKEDDALQWIKEKSQQWLLAR